MSLTSNKVAWGVCAVGAYYAADQVGKKLRMSDTTRMAASIVAPMVMVPILMKFLNIPLIPAAPPAQGT